MPIAIVQANAATPTPFANASGAQGATASTPLGLFAALLDAASTPDATDTAPPVAGTSPDVKTTLLNVLGARLGLSIDGTGLDTNGGTGGNADAPKTSATASPDSAEATESAPIETVPLLPGIAEKVKSLFAALAKVASAVDAGQSIDEDSLAELEVAITDLADALHVDFDADAEVDDAPELVDVDLDAADPDAPSDTQTAYSELAPVAAVPTLMNLLSALKNSPLLASAERAFSGLAAQLAELTGTTAKPTAEGAAPQVGDLTKLLATLNDQAPETADRLAQVLAKLPTTPVATIVTESTAVTSTPTAQVNVEFAATLEKDNPVARPTATESDKPAETSTAPGAASEESTPRTSHREAPVIEPRPRAEVKLDIQAAVATDATPNSAVIRHADDPQTTQALATATIRADHAPARVGATYASASSSINLPHIAFEIVRHVNQNRSRFEIRLDPPELGRIDVKLDMDSTGTVNARLTVERTETLDLLQRDQRTLERALAQAGLDAGKTNLEFSLKQNPFSASSDGDGQRSNPSPYHAAPPTEIGTAEEPAAQSSTFYRGTLRAGGINIYA